MMPEMSGEDLRKLLYMNIRSIYHATMLESMQTQKVNGANVLFFGLGNGITGQFEYRDENTWKLVFGKGDVDG